MICTTLRRAVRSRMRPRTMELCSAARGTASGPRPLPIRPRRVAALALCVMLLAGCAEESTEDRRFANEPAPTQDQPTATIAPAVETEPDVPTAVPASPESLLLARGAPARFYLSVGNELWAVSGGETRQLPLPRGATILALDGSPSGDRVAFATADESGQVA